MALSINHYFRMRERESNNIISHSEELDRLKEYRKMLESVTKIKMPDDPDFSDDDLRGKTIHIRDGGVPQTVS